MAPDSTYLHLFGDVDHASVTALLEAVERGLASGTDRFVLLLSTTGGKVYDGLSAYNFLRGIPVDVVTHNFGCCDSVGVVLFLAGRERYTVPESRFVLHTPYFELSDEMLGQRELGEQLAKLRVDANNMARVIARESGHPYEDILQAMRERTVLGAEEAVAFGLAHEVRGALLPEGARVLPLPAGKGEETALVGPG